MIFVDVEKLIILSFFLSLKKEKIKLFRARLEIPSRDPLLRVFRSFRIAAQEDHWLLGRESRVVGYFGIRPVGRSVGRSCRRVGCTIDHTAGNVWAVTNTRDQSCPNGAPECIACNGNGSGRQRRWRNCCTANLMRWKYLPECINHSARLFDVLHGRDCSGARSIELDHFRTCYPFFGPDPPYVDPTSSVVSVTIRSLHDKWELISCNSIFPIHRGEKKINAAIYWRRIYGIYVWSILSRLWNLRCNRLQ